MTKYKITTRFDNNTTKESNVFEIPNRLGNYRLKAITNRGNEFVIGDIMVGNVPHKYKIKARYSGGFTFPIDITTPAVSFETMSWKEIKSLAESGSATKYLSVGDTKKILLTSGEQIELVLIGINHDIKTNGNKNGLTFYMSNILSTQYPMGESATCWSDSDIRNTYLPRIFETLPNELRQNISEVKKITNGVETTDKLFLLSYQELMGTQKGKYSGVDIVVGEEGKQYEYFANSKIPICQDPTFYEFVSLNDNNKGSFWCKWNGKFGDSHGFLGFIDKYGKEIRLSDNTISNGNITKTKQQWNQYEENGYWLRSKNIQYGESEFVYIADGHAFSWGREYNNGVAFAFCI